ncbi:MAG: LPS export ABC transporter periplasmic protein LptC [Longimicrobiaceae bacterium]
MIKKALPALLAILAACGDTTSPGSGEIPELPADQIAFGVRHVITDEGVRKAVLFSDTAFLYQQNSEADLRGVRLDFFDAGGEPAGELTSRTGVYDWRTGTMTASGEVILIIRDEKGTVRRVETEELHYSVDQDLIWSELPTVMRDGGRVYRGESFESDARFENVRVRGGTSEEIDGSATPPAPDIRPGRPEPLRPEREIELPELPMEPQ